MTKGYGFSVRDIDNANPTELEPYELAHKLEQQESDTLIHAWVGNYVQSAVTVAIEHNLAGRKARSEYIKEPVLAKRIEEESLTEEERINREIQKAILIEEQWIARERQMGLPETVI